VRVGPTRWARRRATIDVALGCYDDDRLAPLEGVRSFVVGTGGASR